GRHGDRRTHHRGCRDRMVDAIPAVVHVHVHVAVDVHIVPVDVDVVPVDVVHVVDAATADVVGACIRAAVVHLRRLSLTAPSAGCACPTPAAAAATATASAPTSSCGVHVRRDDEGNG